jgi:hypothetical protein
MNNYATKQRIDFSNQMVPTNGQLATEQRLEQGCNGWTKTVWRRQRSGPLFHITEIRPARAGFPEKVALSLKRNTTQRQKTLSLLQLLIELGITLFIAGVVAPSLLGGGVASNEALAGGSLRTINIIGVTLSYTYKNVGFAVLGALVGATAAFVITCPATTPNTATPSPSRDPR